MHTHSRRDHATTKPSLPTPTSPQEQQRHSFCLCTPAHSQPHHGIMINTSTAKSATSRMLCSCEMIGPLWQYTSAFFICTGTHRCYTALRTNAPLQLAQGHKNAPVLSSDVSISQCIDRKMMRALARSRRQSWPGNQQVVLHNGSWMNEWWYRWKTVFCHTGCGTICLSGTRRTRRHAIMMLHSLLHYSSHASAETSWSSYKP